jgi:flagellar biosynthesis/type III secretory pathway chaperone
MSSQLIEALAANLESEIDVQNRLLEALRRQRVRLLEGEADGFEEVMDRIRDLLDQTDRNRSRRAALLRSLGVDPTCEEPIHAVASRALPERSDRLLNLRRSLVGISSEVRRINSFNAQLVKRSVEVVDSLLGVLIGLSNAPGYDTSGTVPRVRPGGVLVNQEC